MYEVQFSENARKEFQKLEKEIQERIINTLERIRIRPETYLIKLIGESAYKLRVRHYRIIIDLYSNKLLILVIKIGHRKNIYKNLPKI